MKKMVRLASIVLVVVLCAMLLTGCTKISSEKAIGIALDDLGIDRVGAAKTSAQLDKSVTPAVYNVEINRNNSIECYVINAETGEIISSETIQATSGIAG